MPLVLNWYTIPIPKIIQTFPLKSRGFIVLHLTFRSMIYLGLKFVKGTSYVSRFIIFCYVDVDVPAPIVGKDHLFFIVLLLLPCQR